MPQHQDIREELEALGATALAQGIGNPLSPPPAGYFEQNAARLATQVPVPFGILDTLPRSTVFSVPDGYFDQQPGRILDVIRTEKNKQRRIPMRRLQIQRWMAAAGMALLISAGGYFFLQGPSTPAHDPLQQLNTISDQDLAAYIELEIDPVDAGMSTRNQRNTRP
jgi:hypothetical protein